MTLREGNFVLPDILTKYKEMNCMDKTTWFLTETVEVENPTSQIVQRDDVQWMKHMFP